MALVEDDTSGCENIVSLLEENALLGVDIALKQSHLTGSIGANGIIDEALNETMRVVGEWVHILTTLSSVASLCMLGMVVVLEEHGI